MSTLLKTANALLKENKLQQAYQAFNTILANSASTPLTPISTAVNEQDIANAHFGLGQVFLRVDELDKAIEHLSISCQSLTNNFYALLALAQAFQLVNSHQDVASVYSHIMSRHAQNPEAHYHYAVYCSELGYVEKVSEHTQICIKSLHQVNHASSQQAMLLLAHAWLLRIKAGRELAIDASLKQVEVLKSKCMKWSDVTMVLNYAHGDLLDRQGHYSDAFECWQRANDYQLTTCQTSIEQIEDFFNQVMQQKWDVVTSKTYLADAALQSSSSAVTPIFVLGLARTGSTLIEQILCRHKDVDTLGEQSIISHQVAAYFSQKYAKPYPEFVQEMTAEDCALGARIYMNALKKRQLNSPFIIDKLPANVQSIGLIKAIFPHAKIILTKRSFSDVAISTLRHYFADAEPYFCNLDSLKKYSQLQDELMQFWTCQLGIEVFELSYEQVIHEITSEDELTSVAKSQNTAIKIDTCYANTLVEKLFAHCGINCKNLAELMTTSTSKEHKPIKTLSAIQMSSGINKNGLDSAKPYRAMLPLS